MSEETTPVEETPQVEETVEQTFTQSELEAIVEKRLARERKSKGDYDELKTKAEQFDQLQAEQKTELEKLLERAEVAERERDAIAQRANEQAVRSAIIAEASRQGAIDPDDVAALLDRSALTVEDDKVEGVDEAVRALLDSKPHLLANKTPQPADQGARVSTQGEKQDPATQLGASILKAAGR